MTALDVSRLVKHYLWPCVLVVAVCALLGAILGFSKSYADNAEYSAKSVLTLSEPTGTVSASELMPLAQATANNVIASANREDISISAVCDLASRTIAFTAVSASEADSIEAANGVAWQTAEEVKNQLNDAAGQYRSRQAEAISEYDRGSIVEVGGQDKASALETVGIAINDASQATVNNGKNSLAKYALAGILFGFFLAVCLVVAIDIKKAPVKDRQDIEKGFEIPVLAEEVEGSFGLRLWANVQFVLNKRPNSVCLMPATVADKPEIVQEALEAAASISKHQPSGAKQSDSVANAAFFVCQPVKIDINAAFRARDSDATVLIVTRWTDSLRQIEDSLSELRLAGANVVGAVLLDARS